MKPGRLLMWSVLLATGIQSRAGGAPNADAPVDVARFERALERPVRSADGKTLLRKRLFLRLPDEVVAAYAIGRDEIRQADPGFVCAAHPPQIRTVTSPLGRVGSIQTTCTLSGFSESIMELGDGSLYESTCRTSSDGSPRPSSACTGWTAVASPAKPT